MKTLIGVFCFVFAAASLAAVCCGGNASLPAFITGSESSRLNTSLSNNQVIGDAPAKGIPVFRRNEDRTQKFSYGFSGAWRFKERWQTGWGLSTSSQHLGDIDVSLGYEVLARDLPSDPLVLAYLRLGFPTGRSIYEIENPQTELATGTGFYQSSVGFLFQSTFKKYDYFASLQATKLFPREFSKNLSVDAGFKSEVGAGLGYAVNSRWRLGGSLRALYGDPKKIQKNGQHISSSSSLVWPTMVSVSYFPDANSTFNINYEDETLVGPARDTTLSRHWIFSYSYRFPDN